MSVHFLTPRRAACAGATALSPVVSRKLRLRATAAAAALTVLSLAPQAWAEEAPVRQGGVVVITANQPSSLPTRLPTTIEGVDAARIAESINATDSEDALKYLPSLLVRKRYVGDYNHAVLSTRASGTGNSARSMVYADGVLLSNFLGNGAAFTPRWGLVTPEEIARVDVLYGPFSAAYPGNSVGAVVDYVTRMPSKFEAHVKLSGFTQPNDLYGQQATFNGAQASASIGDRSGAFAWWINANRLDSHGQPLVFTTKLATAGSALRGGELAVTGGVAGQNPRQQAWTLIGSSTEYTTTQDHLKTKLAWDITPEVRALYTLGLWHNESEGQSRSWLKDAAGATVDNRFSGDVSQLVAIDGRRYTLAASDFPKTRENLDHVMHALSVKSRTRGVFDWELAGSLYDYQKDIARAYAPTTRTAPLAGRITDQKGTGWNTLAAKLTWRPLGAQGAHIVDAGVQQDSYELRTRVDTTTDYLNGAPTAFASRFSGNTRTRSAYAQDAWTFAEGWITVLGLRAEQWTAWDGITQTAYTGAADAGQCNATTDLCTLSHPARSATYLSPKAALARQLTEEWVLKASTGRAVRFPTVSELYQGGVNAQGQSINNNPDLRPEVSWTTELSAEWSSGLTTWRTTLFREDTRDALYSQLNTATNANTVQNVNRIRTTGLEVAAQTRDSWIKGLELQGSLTYADSRILANDGYVLVRGDTIGKWQPRVPRWRASALATWRFSDRLSASYGMRYSGRQFSTLDNGDPNGFAYTGASKYFTTDVRVRWKFADRWTAAFGIDNLNNYQYWNFHPYPQRTAHAELRFDL